MANRPSNRLLKLVRTTVAQVERTTELGANDPAVAELKRNLLRRIADINDPASSVSKNIPLIEEGPLTPLKTGSDRN
jgi:hypothetical protein